MSTGIYTRREGNWGSKKPNESKLKKNGKRENLNWDDSFYSNG